MKGTEATPHQRKGMTARRQEWDWIFVALWSLCGRQRRPRGRKAAHAAADSGHPDEGSGQCYHPIVLNIPDTVLFRRGVPYKWLATDDDGIVIRKPIDFNGHLPVWSSSYNDASPAPNEAFLLQHQMESIAKSFNEFQMAVAMTTLTTREKNESFALCTAWYTDGKSEVLTERAFMGLSAHERWRVQVLALQAFVKPKGTRSGTFDREVRDKKSTQISVFDSVAKSIGRYAELAYSAAPASCPTNDTQKFRSDTTAFSSGVSVVHLEVEFIIDAANKLWFSHVVEAWTKYRKKNMGISASKESRTPAILEADRAGGELKKLLLLAFNRKVSVQTCFSHFDICAQKYVDVDGLCVGLSKLGIQVSREGAEILMERIGLGSGLQFRSSDLAAFALQQNEDGNGKGKWCLEQDFTCKPLDDMAVVPRQPSSSERVGREKPKTVSDEIATSSLPSTHHPEFDAEQGTQAAEGLFNSTHDTALFDSTYDIATRGHPVTAPLPGWSGSGLRQVSEERGEYKGEANAHMNSPIDVARTDDKKNKEGAVDCNIKEDAVDSTVECSCDGEACVVKRNLTDQGDLDGCIPACSHSITSKDCVEKRKFLGATTDMASPCPPVKQSDKTQKDWSVDVDLLRKKEQHIEDQNRQVNEINAMRQEDKRSFQARKYLKDSGEWETNALRHRAIVSDLRIATEEADQRDLESSSALLKAEKREALRRTSAEFNSTRVGLAVHVCEEKLNDIRSLLEKPLQTEVVMSCWKELFADIVLCMQATRSSTERQRLDQETVSVFRKECDGKASEVRSYGTSLRLMETQHTLMDAGPSEAEMQELTKDFEEKQAELAEMKAVLSKKEATLDYSNRAAQDMVSLLTCKKAIVHKIQVMLDEVREERDNRVRTLRQQREDLLVVDLDSKCAKLRFRLDAIDAELLQAEENDGEYVDTSLWQGTMQRMVLRDFIARCHQEKTKVNKSLKSSLIALKRSKESMAKFDKDILQQRREGEDIRRIQETIRGDWKRVTVTNESPLHRKHGAKKRNESFLASIRESTEENRSHRENLWVSMDYKMNPSFYACSNPSGPQSPSNVNLDPTSNLSIEKADIERILSLPEPIQLALPFLKNDVEFKGHELLNHYTLGRGEDYFRGLDKSMTLRRSSEYELLSKHVAPSKGRKKYSTEAVTVNLDSTPLLKDGDQKFDPSPGDFVGSRKDAHTDQANRILFGESISVDASNCSQLAVTHSQTPEGGVPGEEQADATIESNEDSSVVVVKSIEDLMSVSTGRESFVASQHVCVVAEEPTQEIKRGCDRVHRFVMKNGNKVKMLTLTVSVVFQGVFNSLGYVPGRIAVSMFRLSGECPAQDEQRVPIGFAPYELQAINSSDRIGRVVIVHEPDSIIESGVFEILVRGESITKYSLKVSGTVAESSKDVLGKELSCFLRGQEQITQLKQETNALWTSVRIAERKLSLLKSLIEETENETTRCERDIEECDFELDDEDEMSEEELNQLYDDIKVLEMEFAHWCRLQSIRIQEQQSTNEKVHQMREMRRNRLHCIDQRKREMEHLRRTLPLACAQVVGYARAAQVADILNSDLDFDNVTLEDGAVELMKKISLVNSTPAAAVRRVSRQQGGIDLLTKEEQKWSVLDIALNPEKWSWLKGHEEEETPERQDLNPTPQVGLSNRGLKQYQLAKTEVERIRDTPFAHLRKKDVAIKKLLVKYHDDPSRKSKTIEPDEFDPYLAARTRYKPENTRSLMDMEWISIDRILNPEAWGRRSSRRLQVHESIVSDPTQDEDEANVLAEVNEKPLGRWRCSFSRPEILQLWNRQLDEISTVDERRCKMLLLKYNGSYHDYMRMEEEQGKDTKNIDTNLGRKWNLGYRGPEGFPTRNDVDKRLRIVLAELDKAVRCCDNFMESSVLHVVPQRFPTQVLRLELEREFDRIIKERIFEEEQKHPSLVEGHDKSDCSDNEVDSDSCDVGVHARKLEKRALKRSRRASESARVAQRRLLIDEKSFLDHSKAEEMQLLGFGGCLACKNNPCTWIKTVDESALRLRNEEIHKELLFIQKHAESEIVQSVVARSCRRGGSTRFKRQDLVHELTMESKEIDRRIRLQRIDKELHDAYSSRHHFVEVHALHGYGTLMRTVDAVQALELEHDKLVAITATEEVVDDILEWMLDGWYFGECETEKVFTGYIPIVKRDGSVCVGTAARAVSSVLQNKQQEHGFGNVGTQMTGTPWEKVLPILKDVENRSKTEEAQKQRAKKSEDISSTEKNVKFGLFCVTFMYFRALHLVKREHASWSGEDDLIGGSGAVPKTEERRKMMQEEQNASHRQLLLRRALEKAKIGEKRNRRREEYESATKTRKLHAKYQQQFKEKKFAILIQRCYRGHLGRKVSLRWAMKKAEVEAMNALMNACAITISRTWRGNRGRKEASLQRKEMAEFIVAIRASEAREDEHEYWKNHKLQKWKRDTKLLNSLRRKSKMGHRSPTRRMSFDTTKPSSSVH